VQVAESYIKDSHKPIEGERWDNSLVFYIRFKLHYPKGFTNGHRIHLIAKKMKMSDSTVRRHINILLKLGIVKKDNKNYTLPRMGYRNSSRLSTIKFNKKMSSREIKDLLRTKVIHENLKRQGFMRDLRRDVSQKNDPKRRFKGKELKRIEKLSKKYVTGVKFTNSNVVSSITLSDRTIAKWFNITRESVNRLKKRLYNDGLLLFRKIFVQIGFGFPSKEETGRLFIHKGYLYKSITEYNIPSKGVLQIPKFF